VYSFATLTEGQITDIKAKAVEMEKEAAARKLPPPPLLHKRKPQLLPPHRRSLQNRNLKIHLNRL